MLDQPSTPARLGGGRFDADPVVRLSPDGRLVVLVNALSFTESNGVVWAVPAGTVSDGASIPQFFWGLIGGPLDGQYRNAAIIHDWYCDVRERTWQDTDRAFYDAMLSSGVNATKASQMYYAVYHFGPRWNLQAICNTRRSMTPGSSASNPGPAAKHPTSHHKTAKTSDLTMDGSLSDDLQVKVEAVSLPTPQIDPVQARADLAMIARDSISDPHVIETLFNPPPGPAFPRPLQAGRPDAPKPPVG